MKANRRRRTSEEQRPRRLVTTLGELISAAYEAVPGIGDQRLERALEPHAPASLRVTCTSRGVRPLAASPCAATAAPTRRSPAPRAADARGLYTPGPGHRRARRFSGPGRSGPGASAGEG